MSIVKNVDPIHYDLTSNKRLAGDQILTFSTLIHHFVEKAQENLSTFCQIPVQMALHSVDQLPFSRYLRSLQPKTCLVQFDSIPSGIEGILEINSSIAYSIANKMLGGSGNMPQTAHTTSKLEMAINRKFINLLLSQLSLAWQIRRETEFTIRDIFQHFDKKHFIPLQDICVVATIVIRIQDVEGLMTLAIPIHHLVSLQGMDNHQPIPSHSLSKNVFDIEMELKVTLGKNRLTQKEVKELRIGDILILDKKINQQIELHIEQDLFCPAKPGLSGIHRAVRLLPTKEPYARS